MVDMILILARKLLAKKENTNDRHDTNTNKKREY